jgi:hypothetical protein
MPGNCAAQASRRSRHDYDFVFHETSKANIPLDAFYEITQFQPTLAGEMYRRNSGSSTSYSDTAAQKESITRPAAQSAATHTTMRKNYGEAGF